ncbi:hypothetical protein H6S82_05930 [Planktothrix sp. FACHB-1355]|uniref:Uncharacterized protein n=1 Tax=Aerosakkonema funiforme FACHB-1375 TaxID=2949571 RepID=A0A926VGJ9_9CYAN|nr:hypothetical protein [Aerosakkonema funiforme]MBD2183334.1 hypothetical protein [Aerosakkonema funiforme FACHB-1375]MBD3558393.1 hypothetical protein [Planktothrix sp. FACHB-1355]
MSPLPKRGLAGSNPAPAVLIYVKIGCDRPPASYIMSGCIGSGKIWAYICVHLCLSVFICGENLIKDSAQTILNIILTLPMLPDRILRDRTFSPIQ